MQLVLCSVALQAQEQDTNWPGDTSRVHGIIVADPGIALGKAILILPPLVQPDGKFESFQFLDAHPGIPPPLLRGAFTPKAELLSPYLLQRQRDRQLNTLYIVLGAVELGGAAYIAYRHIKKYGFLR